MLAYLQKNCITLGDFGMTTKEFSELGHMSDYQKETMREGRKYYLSEHENLKDRYHQSPGRVLRWEYFHIKVPNSHEGELNEQIALKYNV